MVVVVVLDVPDGAEVVVVGSGAVVVDDSGAVVVDDSAASEPDEHAEATIATAEMSVVSLRDERNMRGSLSVDASNPVPTDASPDRQHGS